MEPSCSQPMVIVVPWRRRIRPRPDGQDRAAVYRERAARLNTLANAEADPILCEQLRDLARQYDEIANCAVSLRDVLGVMRRGFASHQTAESQTADKVDHAVLD